MALLDLLNTDVMVHKVMDIIIQFLSDLGAEHVARTFFKGGFQPSDRALLERVTTLAAEGKRGEAAEMLRPRLKGLGPEDESIIDSDRLALYRMAQLLGAASPVTTVQLAALDTFLASLSDDVRAKHRLQHTVESNRAVRRANLIQLALMPDDAARTAFLRGGGAFEKGATEKSIDELEAWATGRNTEARAQIALRLVRWRTPLPAFSLWHGWFNFNLFK